MPTLPSSSQKEAETLKLVQITDSHLFSSPDGTLSGMNCGESLDAVLDCVREQQAGISFLLCTGDIVQDGSEAGYRAFLEKLSDFAVPMHWLCGNHDKRKNMQEVLGDGSNVLASEVVYGKWQIILLDSQVPDKIYGYLAEKELELLDQLLNKSSQAGQHTLVCLHHNPVPVKAAWLERHSLKNPEQFFEVLSRFTHVKGVVHGHTHQDKFNVAQGVPVWSTPSTCVQFHPSNDEFTLDDLNPGYRWMELHADGSISTGVNRVRELSFHVDFDSAGY